MSNKKHITRQTSSITEDSITLSDINSKLDLTKEWMEDKFNGICQHLDRIGNRVTVLEDEQRQQAKALTYYGEEIESIKKSLCDLQKDYSDLQPSTSSLTKLSKSIQLIEQEKFNKSLILDGIPVTNKENLHAIIEKLSDSLDLSYNEQDIDGIFRTKQSGENPKRAIIIKFNKMSARDAFYDGRKSMVKKSITTKSLGYENSDKIFINEQLPKTTQELFYKVRCKKRDLNYKYAWTYHGNIFMRKEKTSEAIKISSDKDLIDLN